MGLPQILIEFLKLGTSAVTRVSKGVVAVVLKDSTNETFDTKIYSKESDITVSHWNTANKDYLAKIFLGNPSKVIVERVGTADAYTAALERLKNKQWNYLTIPGIVDEDTAAIVTWIKEQRDTHKRTFKAVLPNTAADHEGIINFCTEDIKVGSKTYTASDYACRIAGILAGIPIDQSCTYYVLSEVNSITESITPDNDIDAGKLILVNDGSKIKIGRGVNSLTTLGTKTADYKKIKIIESVDIIRDDIRTTFENNYVGKIPNSYDNKIIFIAAVNSYFKELAKQNVLYDKFDNKADIDVTASSDFLKQSINIDTWSETQIKQADTGTNVFLTANIKIQDAMEDLKFGIYM